MFLVQLNIYSNYSLDADIKKFFKERVVKSVSVEKPLVIKVYEVTILVCFCGQVNAPLLK